MSLIDWILIGVLAIVLGLAIRTMIKHPSKCCGSCSSCSGNCQNCVSSCKKKGKDKRK